MIKLIVGEKGSGKTKQMVDMINETAKTTNGSIVCVEKGMKLTYDIDHKCRLIDMDEFHIENYNMLYGFVAGILAGNYDIQDLYIDGVLQVGNHDLEGLGSLLAQLAILSGDNVRIIITISANENSLPETVKTHL